jgi:hypothetical protein
MLRFDSSQLRSCCLRGCLGSSQCILCMSQLFRTRPCSLARRRPALYLAATLAIGQPVVLIIVLAVTAATRCGLDCVTSSLGFMYRFFSHACRISGTFHLLARSTRSFHALVDGLIQRRPRRAALQDIITQRVQKRDMLLRIQATRAVGTQAFSESDSAAAMQVIPRAMDKPTAEELWE